MPNSFSAVLTKMLDRASQIKKDILEEQGVDESCYLDKDGRAAFQILNLLSDVLAAGEDACICKYVGGPSVEPDPECPLHKGFWKEEQISGSKLEETVRCAQAVDRLGFAFYEHLSGLEGAVLRENWTARHVQTEAKKNASALALIAVRVLNEEVSG